MPGTTRQTSTKTARSHLTQHRNLARCLDQKTKLLDLLRSTHPHAPALDDLRAVVGRPSARIDELRREGWSIETVEITRRLSTYRLVSLVKGAPIQYSAAVTIHLPVGGQATFRTHERLDGEYTQDRLTYAARKATEAYMRALGRSEAPAPKVKNIDDDLDLDGGVW